MLTRLGVRWTARTDGLPGRPDLVDPSGVWAILVHGCFWHRHEGCSRTTTPKRNRRVWLEKFRLNVERDRRLLRQLRSLGYRAHVIWECETFDADALAGKVSRMRRRASSSLVSETPEVGRATANSFARGSAE